MKNILLSTCCSLFILSAHAQNSGVRKAAEKMGACLVGKDYKGFAEYTYPKTVKEMGGREKMAASIARQMEGMEKQGNKITALTFGEPTPVIHEGKELQCTIPQFMEIEVAMGKVKTTSTLIAISMDNGGRWYFVDAGERDINAVRKTLPNISSKIVLPKPEPPQFTR